MNLDDELFSAIAASDEGKVSDLINRGADVNVKDNEGQTPLHIAVRSSNVEMVKCLIDRGADFDAKNNEGKTPLDLTKDHSIIDYLRGKSATHKLFNAVKAKDYTKVKTLIDNGADVNVEGDYGNTILHTAVTFSNANLEIVKCLVEKGADVNAKDNYGKTPLSLVQEEHLKCTSIIDYLKEKGAISNVQHTTESLNSTTPSDQTQERNTSRVHYDVQYVLTTEAITSATPLNSKSVLVDHEITPLLDYVQNDITNSNPPHVDSNDTVSFSGKVARIFTRQKPTPTKVVTGLSKEEQMLNYTSKNIHDSFKKAVKHAATKSDIPKNLLNIDFSEVQDEIHAKVTNDEFSKIVEILNSHAKKACANANEQIGAEKYNKFMKAFNKKLNISSKQDQPASYLEDISTCSLTRTPALRKRG